MQLFGRIKQVLSKLGRLKCLLGKHEWRYYHRWVKSCLPDDNIARNRRDCISRRVCIHCKRRETVAEKPKEPVADPWVRL